MDLNLIQMNDSNLPNELRRFRERAQLSPEQMSNKVLISVRRYRVIENGFVQPKPDEELLCRNFLNRQDYGTLPPLPWYKRGLWVWVIPALASVLLSMMAIASSTFSEAYTSGRIENQYPYRTLIFGSVVLFALIQGALLIARRFLK